MDEGANKVRVAIFKNGRVVGEATNYQRRFLEDPSGGEFDLIYLAKVSMSPPELFKHMAGTPLATFFDRAGITLDPGDGAEVIDQVRYVHGRSEVLKGSPTVSSVLLCSMDRALDEGAWVSMLPDLYRRFLSDL